MSRTSWTMDVVGDLSGTTAIVTGANTGLGFETARLLAAHNADVVIASRNSAKAEAAKDAIHKRLPDASVEVIRLDLADLSSVEEFADAFIATHERLDLLINNAGIMMVPKGTTRDGFELQFGTNHLGHFALTGHLIDLLAETGAAAEHPTRVVTVSSLAHRTGTMDLVDPMYDRGYQPMSAYSRSKLANLLFAFELQRRVEVAELDVVSVAAHPGVSATDLGNHLLSNLFLQPLKVLANVALQDASAGALPTLRAATDPSVEGGEYFGPAGLGEVRGRPIQVSATMAARNEEMAAELWTLSEELTGVEYL